MNKYKINILFVLTSLAGFGLLVYPAIEFLSGFFEVLASRPLWLYLHLIWLLMVVLFYFLVKISNYKKAENG